MSSHDVWCPANGCRCKKCPCIGWPDCDPSPNTELRPTDNSHGHWIEIDPNVRIAHNHTFTYLPSDYVAQLEVGSAYVVGESEAWLIWPATLISKREDGYVEFDVAWKKGKEAPNVSD